MARYTTKKEQRSRRHKRVRRRICGSGEVPRLCVNFSNRHIYLQIVDDDAGRTLVSASSMEKDFSASGEKTNLKGAELLGRRIAEKATQAGITKIVFDRSGYKYHGRLKSIADAARQVGLQF